MRLISFEKMYTLLELDSDFDSRDGSDNENENSQKYDVWHSTEEWFKSWYT